MIFIDVMFQGVFSSNATKSSSKFSDMNKFRLWVYNTKC